MKPGGARRPFLVAAAAALLHACGAGPSQDREIMILGAAPLPQVPGSDDAPQSRRPPGELTLADIIETFVKISKDDLWPCLPQEQRDALAGVSIRLERNSTAAFLMYSAVPPPGSAGRREIVISEVTWRNFAHVETARQLIGEGLGIDDRWFTHYMLYARRASDFRRLVSPAVAAGLAEGNRIRNLSPERQSAILDEVVESAHRRATFLLGHEFYHHLYRRSDRARSETAADFQRRQAEDEQKADAFAMNLMLCRAVIERNLDPLATAPRLFLDWMLVMEGARHRLDAGTHPLDHARAREAARYAIRLISSLPSAAERGEILDLYREVVAITERIDREGAAQYFGGINEEARPITLESLRLPR